MELDREKHGAPASGLVLRPARLRAMQWVTEIVPTTTRPLKLGLRVGSVAVVEVVVDLAAEARAAIRRHRAAVDTKALVLVGREDGDTAKTYA